MDTDTVETKPSPIEHSINNELIIKNYGKKTITEEILKKNTISSLSSLLQIKNVFRLPPAAVGTSLSRAIDSTWSNRSFDQYLDLLGITEHDLGNLVLDLGSGVSELFARKAQKRGIGVVTVNPKLSKEQARTTSSEAMKEDASYERKAVAALAQALPFKDNCFDSVVSVYAVPYYLAPSDLSTVFKEIVRVLKPGGKAFLSPVSPPGRDLIGYAEALKDLSCAFKFVGFGPKNPFGTCRLFIEKQQTPVLVTK